MAKPNSEGLARFVAQCSETMGAGAIRSCLSGIRSLLKMVDVEFSLPSSIEK